MSEKEQPPIMDQKLCVNGCGFFGSSQTSHMCSKCWKDEMSKTMRDADANSDGAGSSTPLQSDTKPSAEEVAGATAASSKVPQQQLQTGSDSLLEQVPPPPSPATPRSPSEETMTAVESTFDVTALSQPPTIGTTAAPTAMVEEEEVPALNAAALEPAETLVAPGSPMAVCEGNQGNSATTLPIEAGAMVARAAAGIAVTGAAAGAMVTGAAAGAMVAGAAAGAAASAATATAAAASVTPAIAGVAAGAAVAEAAVAAAAEISATRPVQTNRKRCFTCNKKVGYTGIACRCNYVFCSLHRYPEQHDCTFDFKASDREDLKRTVVGGGQFSKLDRV